MGDIYLIAPPTQETWKRLNAEPPEAQRSYWEKMDPRGTPKDEENINRVAEELLAVHRPIAVARWTAQLLINDDIAIRTLEQLPHALATEPSAAQNANLIVYAVTKLLESWNSPSLWTTT